MFEPDPDPSPSDAPAEDRLPPWVRVLFYLPAYLIAQLVTANLAIQVWLASTGQVWEQLAESEHVLVMVLSVASIFFPVALAGTRWFTRFFDRRTLADLGWKLPPSPVRTLLETVGAGAGALVLLGLWLLAGSAGFEVKWSGWAALGGSGLLSVTGLGLVFFGFVLAAAVEELVFRGYVFHALQERGSWAGAAGLQAALFAALHSSNPAMSTAGLGNTFLLGLLLAILVEATGSLYAATLVHTTWNFLVALGLPLSGIGSLGLAKVTLSGPEGWTGGAYGPEGSWVLTVLLVGGVLALAPWADRARSARGEGAAPLAAP